MSVRVNILKQTHLEGLLVRAVLLQRQSPVLGEQLQMLQVVLVDVVLQVVDLGIGITTITCRTLTWMEEIMVDSAKTVAQSFTVLCESKAPCVSMSRTTMSSPLAS